jgi:hypothetical protein
MSVSSSLPQSTIPMKKLQNYQEINFTDPLHDFVSFFLFKFLSTSSTSPLRWICSAIGIPFQS